MSTTITRPPVPTGSRLQAAITYAEMNWRVFPVHSIRDGCCTCGRTDCSSPGKHPLTRAGLKDASTDPETIRSWWKRWPGANVGVVTGRESGVVVVDIDPRHGGDESLDHLISGHGALPATIEVETGGGGRHFFFRYPDVPIGNRANVRPGIDSRGDGGYVVAPPSNHVSGEAYRFVDDHGPNEVALAELPKWLLDLLVRDREPVDCVVGGTPDANGELLAAATAYVGKADAVSEGGRNDAAFRLAGHIAAFQTPDGGRLGAGQINVLMRSWNLRNRPPLGDRELDQVVESALSNGRPRAAHVVEPPIRKKIRETTEQRADSDSSVASDPWPDPMDEAAYHGLAGEIVNTIGPHSEADPVAILVQFLVMFGNVIGRTAHFTAEADAHYCNLFTCLVGTTAKGRKGTSEGQVRRIVRPVDEQWHDERIMGGLSSGEGLIWNVRDPISKQEALREGGRKSGEVIGYQDVIVDPGIEDKRLLVVESEFGSVLKVIGRERNTLSAIIRQSWDTGNLRTLTKNSPATATCAHISIVGHITRAELQRLVTEVDMANGLCNRFLWICVKRSKLLPEGGALETVDLAPIVLQVQDAVDFARTVGTVRRDGQARAIWHEVYPDLSEGKPGLLGAATSRAEAQTMRLATIYAILDQSPVIRAEHLLGGLAVWQYAEQSAKYIFGSALGDPVADAILGALRQHPEDGLARNDIREMFSRNKRSEEIGRALEVLNESGLAYSKLVASTGVRPKEMWFACR